MRKRSGAYRGPWRASAILCAAIPAISAHPVRAATGCQDRLTVESLLIESGFSGASLICERAVWHGEGARDGRLIRFVVADHDIRVVASRTAGGGPLRDRP